MAMPDISLIVPLCNLFNVTADELLGIDLARRKEHIMAICDEADKYSCRGHLQKAREILEEGLQSYPDNLEIIYNLMYVSSWQKDATGERKYLDEAIKWGEKILAQSTEDYQRHSAIQVLCFSYSDSGRIEEAEKMANSMPYLCLSNEILLSSVYTTGDKAYKAKQGAIYNLFQHLSNQLFSLQTTLDSGKDAYTPEEKAILNDKRIALIHLFFENGDFGLYHCHLCDTHVQQALYYAQKGEDDLALNHLSLAAEHAIGFITSISDKERTSLIFRGQERGSWTTNSSENDAARLLKRLENRAFDQIRETEEFIKIKNELSQYAGKWDVK